MSRKPNVFDDDVSRFFETRASHCPWQCARTLGHYAVNSALRPDDHERLLRVLLDKFVSDPAYPVRAIAAEVLSDCGAEQPEIRECLIEAFRKSEKKDANVQRALVKAIGAFGPSAQDLFPLVKGFVPHRRDSTGEVIKAAAILRLTSPGQPDDTRSMTTLIESLRHQPFAASLQGAREIRRAALDAIRTVPMPKSFRMKLIIERMVRRLLRDPG